MYDILSDIAHVGKIFFASFKEIPPILFYQLPQRSQRAALSDLSSLVSDD